jgi:hypothetical protein
MQQSRLFSTSGQGKIDLANLCSTGGLAVLIAHSITEQTSHSVVLLSRAVSCRRLSLDPRATLLDAVSRSPTHVHTEKTSSLISNQAKPALAARGFQIAAVDYDDADDLKFALRGINTVISTVTGPRSS